MDFKQLEAFVKVVELRSFSKAADAIYVSQPSVSNYVKSLETELACELINRGTKEVTLTHGGKIFYEKAKELLLLKNSVVTEMSTLNGNFSGEISILASSVPSQYILPAMLAGFSGLYPEISVRMRQAETSKVVEGVGSGLAEIGFCGGIFPSEKCDFFEFAVDRMVVVAPKSKHFDNGRKYPLAELFYEHDFIGREFGSGTKSEYENFFKTQNIEIQKIITKFHFDNTQSIINAVIHGLGIAVVSEFAAKTYADMGMIDIVKTEIELPRRKFYYVLKKNFIASHLVKLLANFILKEYFHTSEGIY